MHPVVFWAKFFLIFHLFERLRATGWHVVFSFFKKDSKESKDRSTRDAAGARAKPARPNPERAATPRPAAGPSGAASGGAKVPPQRFATTENSINSRDFHRNLAMETAAKIDAIESEMARDFLRPMGQGHGNGSAVPAANSAFTPSAAKAAKAAAPAGRGGGNTEPMGDDVLGNINAIEINTSGAGSVIDETAILFANGLVAEAQAGLSAALDAGTVGQNVQTAWQMLFELVNQSDNRDAFEKLTMDYVLRFGNSPPSWMDYEVSAGGAAQPVAPAASMAGATAAEAAQALGGAPIVRLPPVLDASVVKSLEELKAHAASSPALVLDASAAQSIDLVAAELLLRVVNAFKRAAHELTFVGLERLCEALQRAVQPGRRDSSDAAWMLLLEVLRLLERQNDFEETGIQYCITFEVSPPSWEPVPPNMKVSSLKLAPEPAPVAPTAATMNDPLQWRGLIDGEGEPHFGRVALAAQSHRGTLVIECRQLRRMAFTAGSALLNLALRLQQNGITLELRNVNALIGALLHLLGVTAVASVQLRRD